MQTWLQDIHPDECEELLARSVLGRIGVVLRGRPQIYPVNHAYDWDAHAVVFPTGDGSKLRGAVEWPWVAYEVDGMSGDGQEGWSVMVVGRAEEVVDPQEVARFAPRRTVLWGAGHGTYWLRIVPSRVTGRRISAVADPRERV